MIGVVFVNFHSEELIASRLRALQCDDLLAVVVDNSGTFGASAATLAPGTNLGFGAACNLGVRSLPPEVDVVCFHNPDVVIERSHLDRLTKALASQPSPGVVAPTERTTSVDRPCGYRYPSLAREVGLSFRPPLARQPAATARGRRLASGRGARFGGGGLLVVDRTAHEAIGGFDERYFLYVEDLDYWDRMARRGRGASFEANAVAAHRTATGSPLDADRREILRWTGVELFVADRRGPWRSMRRVHRLALRHREPSALAAAVAALWDEGRSPRDTAEALGPKLRSGELLRPTS